MLATPVMVSCQPPASGQPQGNRKPRAGPSRPSPQSPRTFPGETAALLMADRNKAPTLQREMMNRLSSSAFQKLVPHMHRRIPSASARGCCQGTCRHFQTSHALQNRCISTAAVPRPDQVEATMATVLPETPAASEPRVIDGKQKHGYKSEKNGEPEHFVIVCFWPNQLRSSSMHQALV